MPESLVISPTFLVFVTVKGYLIFNYSSLIAFYTCLSTVAIGFVLLYTVSLRDQFLSVTKSKERLH